MLTTRGRQHPLTHCNSRKTHPHDAVTAGASAFSDPFGISAAANTHMIIMLKRSLVLITMQIPLLFFHPINIIGEAYFLWVQNYADNLFICFLTTIIYQSNLTSNIMAWKHQMSMRRMTTAWMSIVFFGDLRWKCNVWSWTNISWTLNNKLNIDLLVTLLCRITLFVF